MGKKISPEVYVGKRCNRLVALSVNSEKPRMINGRQCGYSYYLLWRCDCGKEKVIEVKDVISGHTKSCGCLAIETIVARSTIHGQARREKISPTFITWVSMNDRCYVKTSSSYKKYGAKGITVCDRWRGKGAFQNFLQDMGERPQGMTIDRIDGSKGYTPDNCRWATPLEQANNQKSNVKVEIHGKKMNVSQAMRHYGVYTKSGVYYTRLKRGWSVERTFTTPIQERGFAG